MYKGCLRVARMFPAVFRSRCLGLFVICVATPRAAAGPAEGRLWDREPALLDMARTVTISRLIPASDPQPVGTSFNGTAPNLSTQKLKVSLWGPPAAMTLSVNKTDVWDRRLYLEPPLTLRRIREIEEGGGVPQDYYNHWQAYDFPCAKPVGQIIVRCPDFADADQPAAITDCDGGGTRVALQHGGARATVTYLPMMTRNLIAVDCDYEGLRNPVSVRLYRHRDTTESGKSVAAHGGPDPKPLEQYDYAKDPGNGPMEAPLSGSDGVFFWIQQRFPAEKTFPNGFSCAIAAQVVGASADLEQVDGQTGLGSAPRLNAEQQKTVDQKQSFWVLMPTYKAICEAPGSAATATAAVPSDGRLRFTVLVSIVTSAEAKNPLEEAKRRLRTAAKDGFGALQTENRRWYEQLYRAREKGRVFTGNEASVHSRIPEVYGSWVFRHGGSCLPDPLHYEAEASYTYLEQDWSPWHGLPCYNELYFTSTQVRNRADTLQYYYNLVKTWLPACEKNAQEVFNLPGALIQHGYLPPVKPDQYAHTISSWEFCMEIPAQVLKVLWERYDYSGDRRFLEKVAYPAMRETAIFYAHYASMGDDGYYHVIPSVSAEHWGWTKNFERNRDSTSALCMFRWLLTTTADASELLHRDADLREGWREVAGKLAPYPVYATPEGPVLTDVRDVNPIGVDYNWFAGFTPTVLADEINLDSTVEQKELMLRTARLVKGWASGSVGPLLGTVRGVEPEQLINSRSGTIHLFPAVTPDASVAFRDMQARGGFEVSAEYVKDQVTFVQIRARRTTECRLASPWPGHRVVVSDVSAPHRAPKVAVQEGETCLTFRARSGHVYRVRRAENAE